MNENPLLSVIVPVYNVEKYLIQCVDSIREQTYDNLEIILVDDGSPDNCGALCDQLKEQDSRIKVIHQKNAGVSVARNNGLIIATGKYVAFVDGDDYIEKTMYEKLVKAIQECSIVFCRFCYEYEEKTQYRYENNLELLRNRPFDYRYYTEERNTCVQGDTLMCDRVFGSIWRSLFLRKIIVENNITFPVGIRIAEDRLFLLEYLLYCDKAAVVDEYLYHYRMNNASSATTCTFRRHDTGLVARNEFLANKQIEFVKRNQFITQEERELFITRIRMNAVSEIVQNEIRYNPVYRQRLNEIFDMQFYKNSLRVLLSSRARHFYKKKRIAIYYFLIRFKAWRLLYWYLVERGEK